MPFSPHEIENKEFVLSFRGYDREEVRAFLRAAAADYRSALEHSRQAERAELETRGAGLRGLVPATEELKLKAALPGRGIEAEAFRIREAAEHDAHRMIREAEREADEVTRAAEREADEVTRAAERMTGERLEEVTRKTEELRALEERMARRLYFLETALELARRDLGIDDSKSPSLGTESGELPVSARQYLPSRAPESG